MIEVIHTVEAARRYFPSIRASGKTLGFVPTMGALHAGHSSLIDRSLQENDFTAVSIFINPTQFGDADDYSQYPRPIDRDLAQLEEAEVDAVFLPDANELYPDRYRFKIQEDSFSKELEGEHRPGHFDGVLTVVMKLLLLTTPRRAYFGEKDWQQYRLIRDMVDAFFLDTEIVPCPIIRDSDGLALSSRNERLSSGERMEAPRFHEILTRAISVEEKKKLLVNSGFKIDYVEERDDRLVAAVRLGEVRLLDNVFVDRRKR